MKPLTLADPVIQNTTRLGDDAPLVDYLLERDATLADVLALYAGTPPDFTDGIRQSALALFLRQTEPEKSRHKEVARLWHPAPKGLPLTVARLLEERRLHNFSLRNSLTCCIGVVSHPHAGMSCSCNCRQQQRERYSLDLSDGRPSSDDWTYVQMTRERIAWTATDRVAGNHHEEETYWFGTCPHCQVLFWACSPTPAMCRDLKRRVLALLPDTQCTLRFPVDRGRVRMTLPQSEPFFDPGITPFELGPFIREFVFDGPVVAPSLQQIHCDHSCSLEVEYRDPRHGRRGVFVLHSPFKCFCVPGRLMEIEAPLPAPRLIPDEGESAIGTLRHSPYFISR